MDWMPIHTMTPSIHRGGAVAAPDVVAQRNRMFPLGRGKGNPFPERGFRPAGGRRTGRRRRLAHGCITKAQECAGHETPGKDRGVRASLKRWGRRLAKPQRQAGALTADVLAVIRLTAPKPRARGRGFETAEQAAERARFDLALVAVLSDGGCGAARRRR